MFQVFKYIYIYFIGEGKRRSSR